MAAGWEKLNAEPAEIAEKQVSACAAVSALIFELGVRRGAEGTD